MADAAQVDNEQPTLPQLLSSSLDPSTLSTPSASSYLSHLSTLPLPSLEAEPTTLASSSAQLTNALTTLCHTSYPTFLSLHATASTLSSSLSALSSSLESLLSALPGLEASTRAFASETKGIVADRASAARVLEHAEKLHDLLSLPLLLDAAVRSHAYADALLLRSHASGLVERFPQNALVRAVGAACDARVQAMLAQLLRALSGPAKLPAPFRAVGFLRRMDVLEEKELALAFLSGRTAHLESTLAAVEGEREGGDGGKEAQARFVKRHVDAWREGVQDVVTQYTTIFLDRRDQDPEEKEKEMVELRMLLTTFTTLRMRDLMQLLREALPRVADPGLLAGLLTQLTYCATSFARVGMDFRGALGPLFIDAVWQGVEKEMEEATEAWAKTLAEVADTRPRVGRKRPWQVLANASPPTVPTDAQLAGYKSAAANVPPTILASYPPLAVYTNAILTALNGLRLLAPVGLLSSLLAIVDHNLTRGAQELLAFPRSSGSGEDAKKDEAALRATGAMYVRVFVPFVRRALVEGVYGVKMDKGGFEMGAELADVVQQWENWLEPA